ncbi:MAG: ABC transporter ATP-binding protein [Pseudomonadota bacterium]
MVAIKLENLAHAYGPNPAGPEDYALRPALNHVWEDGGAYALLGPSGCGKTTLLNVISGLIEPSQGQIWFGERDVTHATTAERNIAQVFQFPVVYDTMTVFDNLAFPLRNRGIDESRAGSRVREIAERIGMADRLESRARGLTADAKQKISLGRGMVREDVAAILFDEPLTVIDPHLKWELRAQLKQLHRQFGQTMIYVTHDQTEALSFADKVVVMLDGQVLQIGTPEELFERPEHTFVGYFIGSPGMNVLSAEIEGSEALVNGTRLPLGGAYASDGTAEIGVRPEHVRPSETGLPVSIDRVEDIGHLRILRARHGETEINAILPEGTEIPAIAHLTFEPGWTHVYKGGWRVEAGQ